MLDYSKDYGIQGIETDDSDYPHGKALDANPATGARGFPLKADFVNDLLGAFQAILRVGKVSPSGQVENAHESDIFKALQTFTNSVANSVSNTVANSVANSVANTVANTVANSVANSVADSKIFDYRRNGDFRYDFLDRLHTAWGSPILDGSTVILPYWTEASKIYGGVWEAARSSTGKDHNYYNPYIPYRDKDQYYGFNLRVWVKTDSVYDATDPVHD